MKCDVCIVGAGPAGISAARVLAAAGAKVVIVEQHKQPGGKTCGGGLTTDALSHIGTVSESYQQFNKLYVNSPLSTAVVQTAKPCMAVADRQHWTALALDELQKTGVVLLLGERCRVVSAGRIKTDKHSIAAEYIIGADGPHSIVRKFLSLPTAVGIIARQIIIGKDNGGCERLQKRAPSVWFDYNRFASGYGWVFPLDNYLKIGCGVSTDIYTGQMLNRAFFSWLDSLNVDVDKGELQAGAIGCNYAGHNFGKMFLAGDAAGFASPVTGEGIGQAFRTGSEVAKEILDSSYVSPELKMTATEHRRTASLLAYPKLARLALHTAPLLLKSPAVARRVMNKYC